MTPTSPHWFTSSYSNNGGDCVEIATNLAASHGTVPVRDSKRTNHDGAQLSVTAEAFATFIHAVRTGMPGTK
ncbi:DUF397 domain-containing protein [Streptomyces sp. NPDC050560]|uniref:DUF397 domain-containing protein n=1 Tax=Streptomyces sp. NPDC050560 TaxID=3365630 RepID=UPI00378D8D6F